MPQLKKSKAPTACLQNDKIIVYFDKKITDELKGGAAAASALP